MWISVPHIAVLCILINTSLLPTSGSTTSSNQTFTDPIYLNYDGSSFRANLGLNIKLLFIDVAAEYALQEYDVFTIRAGFSIR